MRSVRLLARRYVSDGLIALLVIAIVARRRHGLVGIRERVKIYDSEMRAGTADTGGFVLSARLPLSGHRA